MSGCKKKHKSSGDAAQKDRHVPILVGGASSPIELDRLVIELAKVLGRMAAREDYLLSKSKDKNSNRFTRGPYEKSQKPR